MIGDIISSIIGFGGNLMGQAASERNTAANNATQMAIAKQNIDLQKEFAQHGLSWKIDDAASKGIHPLIALGAQGQSFSPVSVATEAASNNFGAMGQDLGRAVKAAISSSDREDADENKARKLALEKGGLENDILRTELASKLARTSRASGQIGPGMPDSVTTRVPLPRPGPTRTVSGEAVKDDDIKQKYEDFPQTKIVRPFGYPLYSNPYFNDGQQFEDRYGEGEIGSNLKFGVNTVADHLYTGYKMISDNWKTHPRAGFRDGQRKPASQSRWERRW